jgi:hypothetical protein
MSSFLLLNAKDEVLEVTFKTSIFVRAFNIS